MSEKYFRFKTTQGDVTVLVHLPQAKGQHVLATFAWCSQEDANKNARFKHDLGRTIARGKLTCKKPRFVGLANDFNEDSDLNEVRAHLATYIYNAIMLLNRELKAIMLLNRELKKMQESQEGEIILRRVDVSILGVKTYNGDPEKSRFLKWLTSQFGPEFLNRYQKEIAA